MTVGFSMKTFKFLTDIEKNKCDRAWLEEHKDAYKAHLLYPLQELASGLSDTMLSIDHCFEVMPQRTVSRIYRDTRFSHDKSLFKSTMWITFKRSEKTWRDTPAFFFEIFPEGYRYGMGFYQASSYTMHGLRQIIAAHPDKFRKIMSKVSTMCEVQGERYKREAFCGLPDDIKEVVMRKNFYVQIKRPIDDCILNGNISKELSANYKMLNDLYAFLLAAKIRIVSGGA